MVVKIRRISPCGDVTQTLSMNEAKSSIKQALESKFLIVDTKDNSLVFSQHEVKDDHAYRYIHPISGG